MKTSYDDKWVYSDIGQSILRIMSELGPLDDDEQAWSNSFAIEFAKRAYEKGMKDGYDEGWREAVLRPDWECP